ncbi:methylmalonyl-CoA epimerase [Streptomyces mirabilis]|uniref:methylmalonyl-CoA epimerase n=1 Tax=Streptomyces mirabilis TaxID=68239 RepID=UPI0036740CFF
MNGRVDRIDHIGVVCRDLDEAVEFYHSAYGFELRHVEVIESQGVREAMMTIGGPADGRAPYVQLLQPTRPDSAVSAWLEQRGPGVHHIAFGTDDVHMAVACLKERGIAPIFDPPGTGSRGTQVTFLHPRDCLGVLIELVAPPRKPADGATTTDSAADDASARH